jgi:spore germination cell wall hydrolase CwlJ-like protein
MNKIKLGMLIAAILVATPLASSGLDLSLPLASVNHTDVVCLAKNIYHEARGEPLHGQVAVAQVTVNRLRHGNYGNSICAVVYKPSQFSWTQAKHKIVDHKAWENSVLIARALLTNSLPVSKFSALYFHTRQVNPKWNKHKQIEKVIGNHIFYK